MHEILIDKSNRICAKFVFHKLPTIDKRNQIWLHISIIWETFQR